MDSINTTQSGSGGSGSVEPKSPVPMKLFSVLFLLFCASFLFLIAGWIVTEDMVWGEYLLVLLKTATGFLAVGLCIVFAIALCNAAWKVFSPKSKSEDSNSQ